MELKNQKVSAALQPIECEAMPLERPRATMTGSSSKGDFVILGFVLVLFLKIIGLLIVAFWLAKRFPKTVMATVAAIPLIGAARKKLPESQER